MRALINKERSYTYAGYTAFKDLPKDQVRYIKGSYSFSNGTMHLAYDLSRIGNIKLPTPFTGKPSTYGSIVHVDVEGSYTDDQVSSHCEAITYLVRGTPALIPIEVHLHNPIIYSVLKCYKGDDWTIRSAINSLQDVGVWVYSKKEEES